MDKLFSILISGFFCVFLLSGIIKSTNSIFVMFDITLLSMICIFLFMFVYIYFNGVRLDKRIKRSLVILLLLFFYMTLSLFYSKSEGYSVEKVVLSTTNLVAFVVPLIFRINGKMFSSLFVFISILIAVVNVYMRSTLSWVDLSDSNYARLYLNAGVACGFSFLLSCIYFKGQYKTFSIFILTLLLIILGSRGALIGLILSLILPIFHYMTTIKKINLKNIVLPIVVSFVLIAINFDAISLNYERSIGRLELLFTEDGGRSVSERFEHINNAIAMFEDKPLFGHGIGSYGFYTQGVDVKRYPHNIILEFMAELGVFGALLILLFFVSIFTLQRWTLFTYAVLIFSIFNILKSYSFEDLRIFFGLISLTIAYDMNKKGHHEENLYSTR